MAQPAHDLTAGTGLSALSGTPVAEIADQTLTAGRSLLAEWQQLEPIVKQLIRRVRAHCEHETIQGAEALKALSACATVVQKLAAASAGVLRAADGLSRLALLLDAGRLRRPNPKDLTQKQLAEQFMELGRQIVQKTGKCPWCTPVTAGAKITDPVPDA